MLHPDPEVVQSMRGSARQQGGLQSLQYSDQGVQKDSGIQPVRQDWESESSLNMVEELQFAVLYGALG